MANSRVLVALGLRLCDGSVPASHKNAKWGNYSAPLIKVRAPSCPVTRQRSEFVCVITAPTESDEFDRSRESFIMGSWGAACGDQTKNSPRYSCEA